MNTFSLYGVKVDSVVVGGIRNQRVMGGIQTVRQGGSGSVDPYFVGVMNQDPRIEFETVEVATALDAIGIAGDNPATSFLCAFEQNTAFGLRSGTLRTIIPTDCLIVPRTLSVQHNGEATLTYEAFLAGDATTAPFTINTGAQTIGQSVDEKFTLGPCSLEGTAFDPQSLTIDFGIEVAVNSSSGIPWPIHLAIRNRRPTINITTLDVTKLATVYPGSGALGLTLSGSNGAVCYLQKIAEGGGARVAAATTEHISFTVYEGCAYFTDLSGNHNDEATLGITIEPTYDGTNSILVLDTTAAIV